MKILALLAVLAAALAPGADDPRPADEILRDMRRIHFPRHSDGGSPEAVAAFRAQIRAASERKAALALELWRGHPSHDAVPQEMKIRWDLLVTQLEGHALVLEETAEAIRAQPSTALAGIALYSRALATLRMDGAPWKDKLARIEAYTSSVPAGESGARLLLELAEEHTTDEDLREQLFERIVREYDAKHHPARAAAGLLRLTRMRGERLALAFTDAVSREPFDLERTRGRVTILHFWGIGDDDFASLARLEAARDARPDDVALVGVFLIVRAPEGKTKRELLAEHGVTSPQYDELTEGGGVDDAWSWKLGIRRWPTTFVLDRDGRIASTNAHMHLDEVLAELLADAE